MVWQSNLAMIIMDNTQLNAEECNIIAIKFLNRLMRIRNEYYRIT